MSKFIADFPIRFPFVQHIDCKLILLFNVYKKVSTYFSRRDNNESVQNNNTTIDNKSSFFFFTF